jgi:8-oxo-dGTP pyrophosphatase MutT (NUDIX family)
MSLISTLYIPTNPNLSDLFESYKPFTLEDIQIKSNFINFLLNGDDCFLRENRLGGHITCSAWVLEESLRKVLLTHHKKLGKWLQLGGHADGEKDVLRVALKEAIEESGIEEISPYTSAILDLDIHTISENKDIPEHLHYDVRFALIAHSMEFKITKESLDLAWVDINKIDQYNVDNSVLKIRDKWQIMTAI